MQQATDFLDESNAVHEFIAPLDDAALARPTQFKGWTVNDVVRHLHVWNTAADLSLTDPDGFQAYYQAVVAHLQQGGTLSSFEVEWLGDVQGKTLITTWHSFYPQMAARFARADPAARVQWAGPDMSVRSSITARLMETWAHAQAIYDLLGVERIDTDRIRNIVILGVNTYGWTFKNRNMDVPQPMPYLQLTAPSGELWCYGEESSTEHIAGPATAFCQVVTQTRNIADVPLRVTGTNASLWMENAQCFAGAPVAPPAPGVRHRATLSSG